jgi:hypothetical protein
MISCSAGSSDSCTQFSRGRVYGSLSASCEAIWLCKLIAELTDEMLEPIVYCDNQSCIRSLRI